ncbi:hypothetical protein SLEP1_g55969 [Rubroshorea leprosula]|uniref:Uncharacterized protein n=1 Tax=Rubroshorea leprosula TaxID=152421 RepID=A0AAV5MGZ9_9ROSI|nr:hypothetical protein SLEP1_g55969 [Rubroshorea leprosula]
MVCTFTGSRPPRNERDEQEDTQLFELNLNDFRPMPRNLFVGGVEQEQLSGTDDDERTPIGYATQPEQFQIPTRTRQRHPRLGNSQQERPERSTEPARTTELEERTRVLEMAMGKILARLIPDDPLIPLLNRDAQPTAVVATRNSLALSNIIMLTKPRGNGKLNNEPSSSKHNEELMRKNADPERQLQDVQKSIDELKSPRRGQGQRIATQNQKDRKGKAYAWQVMTVNKNRPLKWPFEEAEWENAPITFNSADYKRAEGEPDVMMPHVDPFVATVHIEPHFRMASISFLVVKMESAFNAILGRATLCELKAVILQPHLYMKFPTPQGVRVLKGNQKMARACYQDTFKKVELVAAPRGSFGSHRLTQPGQQIMSISDIEHQPEGVEQKVEPVEPVETIPLNPKLPKRTVKISIKLIEEERPKLLKFLRFNQDVFAWIMEEMPGIPAEFTVHKLSTDPTKRPVVQKRCLFGLEKQAAIDEEIQKLLQAGFIRRVEYSQWVSNPVLIKKPNSKWRMCIDFTRSAEGSSIFLSSQHLLSFLRAKKKSSRPLLVHLPFVRLASRNGTDQLREGFSCGFGDGAFHCRLSSDQRVSCCGSWSSPRCWILSGGFWCRRWGVFDRISSRSVEAVD